MLCVSLLVLVRRCRVASCYRGAKERKKENHQSIPTRPSPFVLLASPRYHFRFLLGRKLGPSASILALRQIYACLDYYPCIFTWSGTLPHELSHPSVDPRIRLSVILRENKDNKTKNVRDITPSADMGDNNQNPESVAAGRTRTAMSNGKSSGTGSNALNIASPPGSKTPPSMPSKKTLFFPDTMGSSRQKPQSSPDPVDPDALTKALKDYEEAGRRRERTPGTSPSRKRQRVYGDR